ncbi:hypothetical protein Tco_0410525 [Tanacetum coccineum]
MSASSSQDEIPPPPPPPPSSQTPTQQTPHTNCRRDCIQKRREKQGPPCLWPTRKMQLQSSHKMTDAKEMWDAIKSICGRKPNPQEEVKGELKITGEGMHAVPPPMTGNYMPSGPDVEVDDSKFTYGPKQTQTNETESQSSEFDTCESNIRENPLK